jgi:hypothetical protein
MSFDALSGLDPRLAEALRGALAELRAQLLAELRAEPAAPGVVAPAEELGGILAGCRALDEAPSQALVLSALLAAVGGAARRVLFLVVRDGALESWAGVGFGAAESRLAELRVPSPTGGLAAALAGAGTVELGQEDCARLLGELGLPSPTEAVAIPFSLRGTVAGLLYLDRGPNDPQLPVAAAQLLTYVAANALETLPLRMGLASATLRRAPAGEAAAPVLPEAPPHLEPAAPAPEAPSAAPAIEPEPASAIPLEAEPELPQPESAPPPEPEAEPPAETGVSWQFETVAMDRRALVAEPVPEPAPSPAPQPPAPSAEPTGEVRPPADLVGPGWAFTSPGLARGEDTRREEARRLARLLVTEIKLYNEEKVEQSRERGNIYGALREEIDRSRRIFEERVAPELRAEADYFHDELVRILAGGDSSTLGV